MSPNQSQDSQDIETATTAILPSPLWAASGQAALESSRILVISASATSTSILKNLVLPGIGHFTILDPQVASHEDIGNNFFLEGLDSLGKPRAEEAVRLLCELNDSVEGKANLSSLEEVLEKDPTYLTSFTLIIAHNLKLPLLTKLSTFLWSKKHGPSLMIVRSAGFLAEFFIQFHEHTVVDSHSETAPSLRIDKPFKALHDHAVSINFDSLDDMEHGHVPYVVILVQAMENWKAKHGGPPQAYAEKQEFKKSVEAMRRKIDEENFDEAFAQAYRAWTPTTVPSDIAALFNDDALQQPLTSLPTHSAIFFHLVAALKKFTSESPYTLPLSSTLPDMKADTNSYIHLQTLYKQQAEVEKARFKSLIGPELVIDDDTIDEFVRNVHGLRLLRGKPFGAFDRDQAALVAALSATPKEVATHLALSALSVVLAQGSSKDVTAVRLRSEVNAITGPFEWPEDAELNLGNALGELARAPTAELPNTAALLGGLVAQEAIKIITRQYVPVKGYCVIDLIGSWTGTIDG
ncbi:hypothetical protein Clacol_007230 [Clathrus columnatus]|uniref:NEDD8-activating enzyme E1 regulatory subunit n=1 Tax=Clathrus columnatus TaxID=1419009 RepID=A0AAV5AIN5_9AGAM|nr:hypothetical protein Clacol_007230 [Clathrus columnatus]